MGRTEQLKVKDVGDVLKATMGKVYITADRLGCCVTTVYAYLKKYPELRDIQEQARGKILDTAETALQAAVLKGEAWAVCFTLKTIGQERGYIETVQYKHDLNIGVIVDDNFYGNNAEGLSPQALVASAANRDEPGEVQGGGLRPALGEDIAGSNGDGVRARGNGQG